MEEGIDRLIGKVVRGVRENLRVLVTLALLVAGVFSSHVIRYIQTNVTQPVTTAVANGISRHSFASAVALGVCSGLSAPGVTMPVLFGMARVASSWLGAQVDAPVIAIAAAINVALTVPDLVVWQAVYSRIGSTLLPGGVYIRPFLAGSIPWLLSVPLLYPAAFAIGGQIHAAFL